MNAIQFILVSETQRKFGISKEYNSGEIAALCGCIVRLRHPPTPDDCSGLPRIEIVNGPRHLEMDLGDWLVKDPDGGFYVSKTAPEEG